MRQDGTGAQTLSCHPHAHFRSDRNVKPPRFQKQQAPLECECLVFIFSPFLTYYFPLVLNQSVTQELNVFSDIPILKAEMEYDMRIIFSKALADSFNRLLCMFSDLCFICFPAALTVEPGLCRKWQIISCFAWAELLRRRAEDVSIS